jgi:futalosine hydrolase
MISIISIITDTSMSIKILYVTATKSESDSLRNIVGAVSIQDGYRIGNLELIPLIGGVGTVSTAWTMKQWISVNGKPDLAINGGIAGSFKDEFKIGDVVMPVSDCFADAGIEDGDKFITLFEAGLMNPDESPFREGSLWADLKYSHGKEGILKKVRAVTVNTATGSESTRIKLLKKYNPDIETMEGAAFFYICARENIPFLALRAISNKVEPRNKQNWNISLALENLSGTLREVLIRLE